MDCMHVVGCLSSVIGAVIQRECDAERVKVLIGKLCQQPLKHLIVSSAAYDFSMYYILFVSRHLSFAQTCSRLQLLTHNFSMQYEV